MIGVDWGSSVVKWFDGKRFGTGIPQGKSFVVGTSSSQLLVYKSFYPICSGSKLKQLVLNDVSTDLSVEPEELYVAFCPVKKLETGCELLIFVEKREKVEELLKEVISKSQITVDLLGGVTAALTFSDTFTLVDAGSKKVALVNVRGGSLEKVEVLRGGYDYHLRTGELFPVVKEMALENVFLIGGGALSEEFRKELSASVSFTVPKLEPFGEETPLYFNAFGLYNFRKSPCRAFFKSFSLFSQELLKEKGRLLFTGTVVAVSLLGITGGLFLNYLSAKRDYLLQKKAFKRELYRVTGEKILAPEIQIPEELNRYRELAVFLRIDQPSLLYYVDRISKSVVNGVRVVSLEGTLSSGQFTIKGRAKRASDLELFVKNLKRYFKRVSVSSAKETKSGVKFAIRAEVKSETK